MKSPTPKRDQKKVEVTPDAQPAGVRGRPKDPQKFEAIVAAAAEIFMANGYELTSIEAIAKKADVSKLTIYSHFADKEELFHEVIRARCQQLETSFADPGLRNMSAEKALQRIAEEFATIVLTPTSMRVHRIIQAEAARRPEAARAFYEAGPLHVRTQFIAFLREWNATKQLRIPDFDLAAGQFFALVKGDIMSHMLFGVRQPPKPEEIRKHTREAVATFMARFRGKAS